MATAYALHLLFVAVWIGGLIFLQLALWPTASKQLQEPSVRIPLLTSTLERFLWLGWAAAIILPVTGFWLIGVYGGMARLGWHIHLMTGVGVLMVLLHLALYLAAFLPLRRAVAAGEWDSAGRRLEWVRWLTWVLLLAGVLVILLTGLGARGGL
jgi:uncharacterized membrane protein